MKEDLVEYLRQRRIELRILKIKLAQAEYLFLRLVILVSKYPPIDYLEVEIFCTNAVDYAIRPPNPATIEGGPLIQYHERHALIDACGQMIPGGDGEQFNPPLKLGLLVMAQSYVVAEKFEIQVIAKKAGPGIAPA